MAKNTRARVRGGTGDHPANSGGAVSLASPVEITLDGAGGNQYTILARHVEGTAATALTLDVVFSYDADTTHAQAINKHLGTTDLTFPLGEESVGVAVTGVTDVTMTNRRYVINTDLLGGTTALPVITFPYSGSGPGKVKFTWTETASAAGTIACAILSDDV